MPEKIPKPSITFEQAQSATYELPDEFIIGALANKLQKPGSKEVAFSLKSYFDHIPADAADKEFATTNAEVIAFRDELTDFVSRELQFAVPPKHRDFLRQRREQFREKLERDKQRFRAYVKGREEGLDLRQNRVPMDAIEFYGMTLPVKGGQDVDLLGDQRIKGIRPNIHIQREIAGQFVHWESNPYTLSKANGGQPEFSRRIYMNPRPQEAVGVFTEAIHAVNNAGLTVKGKIYDRTNDSFVMKRYGADTERFNVRGDGIVFYAGEDEADSLLGITEEIYKRRITAFKGRGVPSVPLRVGDGFALGDEPDAHGKSLTSHRAEVMEHTLAKVREAGMEREESIRLFRGLWRAAALSEGIDPDNPSFNARSRQ